MQRLPSNSKRAFWPMILFGDILKELRGSHQRILVVGPRTVGKTYFMNQSLEAYPKSLGIIQSTITRPIREEGDRKFYNLVTKEQFLEQREYLEFVECDEHFGDYYGSSFIKAREVLKSRHGISAMTPEGVMAWHKECRFDFNLKILVLTATEAVLIENMKRRGILDPAEQDKYIKSASKFVLPPTIPHLKFEMTGTPADKNRILNLVGPLLK